LVLLLIVFAGAVGNFVFVKKSEQSVLQFPGSQAPLPAPLSTPSQTAPARV